MDRYVGAPEVESIDRASQLSADKSDKANDVVLASDVVAVASTVNRFVPVVFGADVRSSMLNTALVALDT